MIGVVIEYENTEPYGSRNSGPGFSSWPGQYQLEDVGEAQRPVLGHEDFVDDDVVAAGAAQADGVPDVVDDVVGAREQERAEVGGPVVRVGDDLAQQHPGRHDRSPTKSSTGR